MFSFIFRRFSLAALIIILDQLTKYCARAFLSFGIPHPIFPCLNFTLSYNSGAAFSFLHQAGHAGIDLLSLISLVVSLLLIVLLCKARADNTGFIARIKQFFNFPKSNSILVMVGLNLVLGGAIGNGIERWWYGRVTDFIDFYVGAWHFATFNVADSAVTIGAILLGIYWLFCEKLSKRM